ncbi:hypothetical protein JAAARDRAFT_55767 [Jaapia argillacea MUCL 33604]|uniref:MYND-type domain-containing protein n=1 Tax=Jaapia argillacea MUCL 33604 TaxID=933084 RepID=A0A067QEK9_9AGAM|nr:hypothetical protein JAAARDRAFT_55767 [Jaapia argillacea MUCL 33604]
MAEAARGIAAQPKCLVCSQPADKRCGTCKSAFYCSGAHQKQHWGSHKATCKTTKPTIVLVSLSKLGYLDTMYARFFEPLRTKATLSEALSPDTAISAISLPSVAAVIVTDAGIAERKNRRVVDQLVQYALTGGTVIFGMHFANFIRAEDGERMWRDVWGLPWSTGSMRRTAFALNRQSTLVLERPKKCVEGLSASYQMKALHIGGIRQEEGVYVASIAEYEEGEEEEGVAPMMNFDEVPVAFGRYGEGFVGYMGDTVAEPQSAIALLAMCGF